MDSKINVLLVNKSYYPRIGGIETCIRQVAENIDASKFNVKVLACNEIPFRATTEELINGVLVKKVKSFGLRFSTPIAPSYFKELIKEVAIADIIHLHIPFPLGELGFALFPKILKGKKLYITVHADPILTRWKNIFILYKYFFDRTLTSAEKITTTAPLNLENFPSLRKFKSKTIIIPLAAEYSKDASLTIKELNNYRKNLGILSNEKIILFVGRLSYYKGVEYLLAAMKTVDAKLLIVGSGELDQQMKSKAIEMGITNKVIYMGSLTSKEMKYPYSIADIFVLPSITSSEAFGIVQAEALQSGIPIINTDLPTGVPFVSIHNETGLTIPPRNSELLSKAINTLLKDDDLRMKFSKNAIIRSKIFSIHSLVTNHENLYLT